MRTGRIVALVVGCLLALPAGAMFLAGGALGAAYLFGRDDDGYFTATIDRVATDTVAVTADDLSLGTEPGSPDRLIDALDVDVRLDVVPTSADTSVFVGIGPQRDVDAFLSGVAHERIVDLSDGLVPEYEAIPGADQAAPPADQPFWVAQSSGTGRQVVEWEADEGDWAIVLMNADGSPGVAAEVEAGAKSDIVAPLALGLLGVGAVLMAVAVSLIVIGAKGAAAPAAPAAPAVGVPGAAPVAAAGEPATHHVDPVTLRARLDPELSRWQWLVKWFLAIPHFVVLAFLWVAFAVLTLVAAVAILFTGRYPRGIFQFNVGVLRWTLRVSYYATTGGIGTDRYPPFSLAAQPEDPARLDVDYPERLSRPLVLVKWLLAFPHLVIVAVLAGGSVRWLATEGDRVWFDPSGGGGLLGLLVLVAGVALLFTGRYPAALFDLIVGLNRWVYRVIAYVALMTDRYPPFRLDQGGDEPVPPPDASPPPMTGAAAPLPPPAAPPPEPAPVAAQDSAERSVR
jgi:hypothetical protein